MMVQVTKFNHNHNYGGKHNHIIVNDMITSASKKILRIKKGT